MGADAVPAVETQGCYWAAGGTHRGRNRANNEDSFLCACERGLFVVCDGMGGQAAGEVASSNAVDALDELLSADTLRQALAAGEEAVESVLAGALERANRHVVALGESNRAWAGMASTVVIALVDGERVHVANLGDSRAYQVRGRQVSVLTTDHSVAATLVEQGELTPEQARTHPLRNHLTSSLGIAEPMTPGYTCVEAAPGDRIVLCSDGLWDMVPDEEIARITMSHSDPRETVEALIDAANEAGGKDNITAIVVLVGGRSAES